MSEGCQTLTEKEKQTLRLMGRGHDAKSMARLLGLSVYTVHERLRAARRKLSVSSSREAARLLLESEPGTPYFPGDKLFGEAVPASPAQDEAAIEPRGLAFRRPGIIAGVLIMSMFAAMLLLTMPPQGVAPTKGQAEVAGSTPVSSPASPEMLQTARDFLAMVDAGRWADSYNAMAQSFRTSNTQQVWAEASDRMRAQLGAVQSRTFLSHETVPGPPAGYEMMRFRASYANRSDTVERVMLVREGNAWRVTGITIDWND